MNCFIDNINVGVKVIGSTVESRDLINKMAYLMGCCVASLRYGEGFMDETKGLSKHIKKVREVPLASLLTPLLARLKGETGIQHHL